MKSWMIVALGAASLAVSTLLGAFVFPGAVTWGNLSSLLPVAVEKIQSFITWGSQNIAALTAIIAPFAGVILWIANKAYTNLKASKNLEVDQIKQDLLASGSEKFKLTQDLQTKNQAIQTLTGKLEAYESGSQTASDLQLKVTSLEKQLELGQVRFNTMENTLQNTIKETKAQIVKQVL